MNAINNERKHQYFGKLKKGFAFQFHSYAQEPGKLNAGRLF
jgi:hypothetical protein